MPLSPIFTRVYTPERNSEYKDQLQIWCDRMKIGHIGFRTIKTEYRDDYGHVLFQAVPIFPHIIYIDRSGRGQYNNDALVELTDSSVVGWATSKRQAEETAAALLLTSRWYCPSTGL
ncbi:unnamed protein product [Rhizoctonia solani]|uniref:Uncharacterized protein n=1 Tax=Rhizoctonia solani TaxID=456999 RepID=A0A8H3I414_9AGAM|nr:unnamed protein product [Rhizoctonia solani]